MCGGLIVLPSVYPVNNVPVVSVAHAEIKTYVGTGRYIMSDFENQQVAQKRAIDRALRDAQQQSGEYLQTYSRSINGNLSNEEISTITNNIVEVLETNCVPQPFEQDGEAGLMYTATVRVNIDTDGVRAWLRRDTQDRTALVNQNNAAQQAADANDQQVEDLRKRAKNATTDEERAAIQAEYQQADNEFLANQKLKEGLRLYYQGEYNGAIAKYNEAIQLNPNSFGAYNNRGIVYVEKNNHIQAIADYTKAIELKPDFAYAYNNRGASYIKLENYAEAIADLSKAIDMKPEYAEAYNNRGLAYIKIGNYTQAIADLSKAIALNPNFVKAYNNRGFSYGEMGNNNAAISDYTRVIQINPNDAAAYNNRGVAYYNFRNYKQAIADYNKAIELNPQYAEVYTNRGSAYLALQNYSEAIADLNKAIELNPKFAGAYYNRGVYYQEIGADEQAQADFAKARALGYTD